MVNSHLALMHFVYFGQRQTQQLNFQPEVGICFYVVQEYMCKERRQFDGILFSEELSHVPS
jgi:hypothetical protein